MRSPSPPTSASTLSSSFNGGNSTGNTTPTITTTEKAGNPRKDEWVTTEQLQQPIPNMLEIVSTGERCGIGMEEWENMLSEPGQEQSLIRWITGGDVEENNPSFGLKQLLHSGNNSLDFDGNNNGVGGDFLGIVDHPATGFESLSGIGGGVSSIGPNLAPFPVSGFAPTNGNNNNNGSGKLGSGFVASNISNSNNFNIQSPIFGSPPVNIVPLPVSLPPGLFHIQNQHQQFETREEKPQILNPQVLMNQQHPQSTNLFLPLSFPHQENHPIQPQMKRHNPGGIEPVVIPKLPFPDLGHELLLRKQNQQLPQQHHLGGFPQGLPFLPQHFQQKPVVVKKEDSGAQQQQHHQTMLDQLYKVAEMVGTGNFSHAQGILARLNQQLSPVGKPLYRAAFYFKEALQLLLLMNNNPVTTPPLRNPTPFDAIFKMGAYKVFSEVSPLIQFANFTCNQAILEALDDADRIHIIDFDIGFGAQWASFMQELPRNRGVPWLKITAFASPSTHHPVELVLMRENLTQFANEIGINFELDVINFDSLEGSCYSLPIFRPNENEVVAVNLPIWCSSSQPAALPSLLRFVKQLFPKIVVSLDRGCDRCDLPFPQHILHALQSYIHLLASLDAVNMTSDAVNKIERFLLQPRIESTVLGHLHVREKMPHWKTIFASAGFSPMPFSNFTESQAECLVKRAQVRGFQVEKRQALLVLCWQSRELISASAWRC